jgi:hypothetical protein
MALWYIQRHGREAATKLIRDGIKRYNERHANFNGYHETITLAWIAVIDRFLAKRGCDAPISDLAVELLEACGEKDYLLRFYSRARLLSDDARYQWVPPDLAAIS